MNSILYYAIYPVIVCSLCNLQTAPTININTALFLLNQILEGISYQPLLNMITTILIMPEIPSPLISFVENYPKPPSTYQSQWTNPSLVSPPTFNERTIMIIIHIYIYI